MSILQVKTWSKVSEKLSNLYKVKLYKRNREVLRKRSRHRTSRKTDNWPRP